MTFRMPEQNRTVVEQVRQVVIDGILYDCSWSALHTQKGWDGEDLIMDPKHGLISAKSGQPEPSRDAATVAFNAQQRGGMQVVPPQDDEAYYGGRQPSAASAYARGNPAGARPDYREAEYRDYDSRRRVEPAAGARPYGATPGVNPNAFYDPRRNVPSGYPQSAYGGSRGYPPVDYERERALAMSRGGYPADYYPPARPDPRDPYYDPRDPYAARYAAGRDPRDPYAAAGPAGRYPPRDPYDRRDIGYEQDLYDRRRYPSMLPPDNGAAPLPGSYHRPGYPAERDPYDPRAPFYASRRPEDDLRYGAPYPPSERDYLDPRRAPAGPAGAYPSGLPYDVPADRLRFDGLREAPGSATGYHGLELDELGLPIGRPAVGAGNPAASALGLKPSGPDGQREVDPLWKGFSGGSTGSRGYFATSADPRANFLYNGAGAADMNSTLFGNRNATGSELDGSALPPQPPAAGSPKRESLLTAVGGSPVYDKKADPSDSSFRMDSLVDALWSPALPAGNVPLEALESEDPLSYGEKPAESASESAVDAVSQENVVNDASEGPESAVMPPGLAKADLSTSTTLVAAASRKQSTDDDLDALIGE